MSMVAQVQRHVIGRAGMPNGMLCECSGIGTDPFHLIEYRKLFLGCQKTRTCDVIEQFKKHLRDILRHPNRLFPLFSGLTGAE
jgi:hypothetical protein